MTPHVQSYIFYCAEKSENLRKDLCSGISRSKKSVQPSRVRNREFYVSRRVRYPKTIEDHLRNKNVLYNLLSASLAQGSECPTTNHVDSRHFHNIKCGLDVKLGPSSLMKTIG